DQPSEAAYVERLAEIFRREDGRVLYVELEATQEERIRRNVSELRLAEKPSKRDVAASEARLREHDAIYRLNSAGELDGRDDYLRIDNTHLSPEAAAERILAHFDLERAEPSD